MYPILFIIKLYQSERKVCQEFAILNNLVHQKKGSWDEGKIEFSFEDR